MNNPHILEYCDCIGRNIFGNYCVCADSCILANFCRAYFLAPAPMYTLSHMVGAPYDFESLIVFAPIVTCWKITTFRPICADLVINIPLTPCGRISGDSMWASMLMLAARLVMYRFQTSAFHRAFFMWYDLYRRQILRLYINVTPPQQN